MYTHAELLAELARPWLDLGQGRRRIAKNKLPPHAHEPSPNVLVVALPKEAGSSGLKYAYEFRDPKHRLEMRHCPACWVWQLVTPTGKRLLIFSWVDWRSNSKDRFEEFCRETQREIGTFDLEGTIHLGSQMIPFQNCRLVHQDDFAPRAPITIRAKSAKSILSTAQALLKRRSSQSEDIDYRELFDDEEARDDALQEQLEEKFRANLSKYEKILTSEYGPPAKAGPNEHRNIPINGVLQHVIWNIGKKSLYLALSHEDRELPWVVYLGIEV